MNDIEKIVVSGEQKFHIISSMDDATNHMMKNNQPLFIQTDTYPSATHVVKKDFLEYVSQKNIRILIEYPAKVDGVEFGKYSKADCERTVVTSDFFGETLPRQTILVQHNCWFHHVKTPVEPLLILARVAGYRHTVFGIPEKTYPILFQHPVYPSVMIATTCFSNLISARFTPQEDWRKLIQTLLTWLNNDSEIECDWQMSVNPYFNRNESLPNDIEQLTFKRNVAWFHQNIFFEHAGKIGVFEGYISGIDHTGRQSLRPKTRTDCTGEAVMATALDWVLNKNPSSLEVTGQIMDTLFNGPELPDNNPESQTYGCLKFYEYISAYYSDDNCRAVISCILASELTQNYDYAENILRCLFSILRTTGPQGFRHGRLDNPSSFTDGKTWKYYHDEDYVEYRPHYQASMWAAFIQAYVLTGHQEFLDKAKTAIRMTMENFKKLMWTNGITQEYARMLLPLAFLIQVEDTDEYRQWLRTVTEILLEQMQPCGAIREIMGDPDYGKYPAPKTNEEYGSSEASLIQKNGDPASDLVYTVNYAFIGLHEAAMATKDQFYIESENRLADFLCRIQVQSTIHPYLNGCWMRGFDDELWEFYGSSADNGWGAWCVESGWTNTWIAATLGLRRLKRSLLCRENPECFQKLLKKVIDDMNVEYRNTNQHNVPMIKAPGAE